MRAPLASAGPPIEEAAVLGVLLHGRGGTPEGMLDLARAIELPDVAWLAPAAADGAWYPRSFLAPLADNEPALSSALARVGDLLADAERAGLAAERTVLLGFSQGACLALEFAARNARRYGGVVALSGGLIGPDGTPRDYAGSLGGTPVFVGCSDVDPHVPLERVRESAAVFHRLGARVTARIYPGMAHTVNEDELAAAREILQSAKTGVEGIGR